MRFGVALLLAGTTGCHVARAPNEVATAAVEVAQASPPAAQPPSAQPSAAPTAQPPAAPTAQPPPGSAYVDLEVDDPDQTWVLRSADGQVLCQVPCSRWVPPNSGWVVDRVDKPHPSHRAYMPDEPLSKGGPRLTATILPKRGSELGPAIMLYAGGSIAVSAMAIGIVCVARGDDCRWSSAAKVAVVGIPAVYLGAAFWWYLWTRNSTTVEWAPTRVAAQKPSVRVGAGVVNVQLAGVDMVLAPGLLAGRF